MALETQTCVNGNQLICVEELPLRPQPLGQSERLFLACTLSQVSIFHTKLHELPEFK